MHDGGSFHGCTMEKVKINIIRGSRSEKYAAKAWKCKNCGNSNEPKELLIFDVPAFNCRNRKCGTQFSGIVYFCLADVEVNGHSILPEIKNQGEKPECIPYAFCHAQEFNDIIEKIIVGEDPTVDPLDPDDLTRTYSNIFPNMSNCSGAHGLHKFLYTALILKRFGCRTMKGGERRSPGSDSVTVVHTRFEDICHMIADGRGVVAVMSTKKKFHKLQFGQVYWPPNVDGKTIEHAVMLVGALLFCDRCIYMFLNSYGKQFCALLNSDGEIVTGGIGMFLSILYCNVIVLSRSWEKGGIGKLTGTWRTDLTGMALDEEVELLTGPSDRATFSDKEILNSGGGVLAAMKGALDNVKLSVSQIYVMDQLNLSNIHIFQTKAKLCLLLHGHTKTLAYNLLELSDSFLVDLVGTCVLKVPSGRRLLPIVIGLYILLPGMNLLWKALYSGLIIPIFLVSQAYAENHLNLLNYRRHG